MARIFMFSASFFHDNIYYRTLCGLQFIQSVLGILKSRQAVWLVRGIANEINLFLNSCPLVIVPTLKAKF